MKQLETPRSIKNYLAVECSIGDEVEVGCESDKFTGVVEDTPRDLVTDEVEFVINPGEQSDESYIVYLNEGEISDEAYAVRIYGISDSDSLGDVEYILLKDGKSR